MSPQEILEQQRARSGLPDPDEHPKLYSDELLDDMKEVLVLLERRVQDGMGSIGSSDIERFVSMSNNILVEMKEKEYQRLNDAAATSSSSSAAAAPATTESSTATTAAAVVETAPAKSASAGVDTAEKDKTTTEEKEEEEVYDPEVEGPDYDPAGGQGSIPKDTRNTYIIPGMDAMSPEEYRVALQQSIIDRQSQRKASGKYGNRNTWDYLNNLSGDTGVLKDDADDSLEN